MYDARGERVEPREVLDDEELREYFAARRLESRRGRAVRENTEEAALAAYERDALWPAVPAPATRLGADPPGHDRRALRRWRRPP